MAAILRQGGRVTGIVEERDATDDQKAIAEINTSVYCFDARRLWPALAKVRPTNDQGEYYLTDVIGILARAGERIEAIAADDPVEALGINDRKQLAAVAAIQRRRTLDRLMEDGVTIVDPATHLHRGHRDHRPRHRGLSRTSSSRGTRPSAASASSAAGCPGERRAVSADRVVLRPYCVIAESVVESGASLGPFCHLRPESHVGAEAHVGNFVELKKTRLGRGAKAHAPGVPRRRHGGRRRQRRGGHHHLQLRRRRQAPHHHRGRRVHRHQREPGRAHHHRGRARTWAPARSSPRTFRRARWPWRGAIRSVKEGWAARRREAGARRRRRD